MFAQTFEANNQFAGPGAFTTDDHEPAKMSPSRTRDDACPLSQPRARTEIIHPGGGFVASQGGKAEGGKDGGEVHTVRRVTVKQLFQAVSGGAEDIIVDGQQVGNVTLIGKCNSFVSNATFLSLELDDGTGKVLVKQFKQDTVDYDLGNDIKDGIYVKVIGQMSHYNDEWHVNAFSVRPLADHNELTYHLSQIMMQHAHFTVGDAAAPAANANQAANAGFAGNMDPGMQPMDAQVDGIFKDFETNMAGNDTGFTVQDVVAASNNRLNADAVMKSIHRLVDAGHLYSTIDDNHWKSCQL